ASPDASASFRGGGVVVSLNYPEEAQPNSTITHEIMITATVPNILQNFTIVIKASINSSWVEIKSAQDTTGPSLPKYYNLTISIPEDANGKLQCYIFVEASSIKDLSITFYSTLVSEPTFSEMQVLFYKMRENYTSLLTDYATLLNNYNETYFNYNRSLLDYQTLLGEYNQTIAELETLKRENETLWADYSSLLNEKAQLSNDYNEQVNDYKTLNETYRAVTKNLGDLQKDYDELNATNTALNQTYLNLLTELSDLESQLTDSESARESETNIGNIIMFIFVVAVAILIAFVAYIKRKQDAPYIVIRKETVQLEPDEEP
ncbi:MAG: hypothetical protein ACWGNP_02230, partial [Candidatus Bathyarchaeia archaeon]